jgi:hypothetical protein
MDFLNHGGGGVLGFYQVFLLSTVQCTVTELKKLRGVSLKKYKSKAKAVQVTVNSKE